MGLNTKCKEGGKEERGEKKTEGGRKKKKKKSICWVFDEQFVNLVNNGPSFFLYPS